MPRRVLLLAALALAACDSESPGTGPVSFQDVDVAAEGDATLAVRGGALVVSGLGAGREGGFVVAGQPDRVDVEIDPLAVPAGGRFGVEVRDGDDVLASLYNEGRSDGTVDLQFDFPGLLGVTVAIVRYRLNGAVVFEARVGFDATRTRGQRRPTSAGSGDGDTGSTHVVRDDGKYVVVSDSDGGGGRRASGCAGFLLTPPPPFDVEIDAPICTDWVEVEPVLVTPVPRGTVAVLGRGVGSFSVRTLDAE